jgi:hypothetical protein
MPTPHAFVLSSLSLVLIPACSLADIGPELRVMAAGSGEMSVQWSDSSESWVLEMSHDLTDWGLMNSDAYIRTGEAGFRFISPAAGERGYFRMRQAGSPSLYIIGDSISVNGTWPNHLAQATGRHTFTQAIGGTTSPTMVNRARGVQLLHPQEGSYVSSGTVRMRWGRHVADRTQWEPLRSWWISCPKAVSEPTRIEVYQGGRFVGLAKHDTRFFITDHANFPKRIHCPGHGFAEGDRVTFLSNDPAYPHDLSVMDHSARWNFSSPRLPAGIIERRVYWAANVMPDSFEVKELAGNLETMDLGGDVQGDPVVEKGWYFDLPHPGGVWNATWKARTKYDDSIWLLEVSANDFPIYDPAAVTIPSTLLLLEQMTEINPRFVVICPPSGSSPDRGPGSANWNNYYQSYLPWVKLHYPGHHLDLMALMDAERSSKERSMLADPDVPELLWIRGSPATESSWEASADPVAGAARMWIGPGYIPLQFRAGFTDGIHLSTAGYVFLAAKVKDFIAAKGW